MKEIVSNLIKVYDGRDIPVILFTKNGGQWLNQIADAGAHAIGIDWTVEIGAARKLVGEKCALQGNMDPAVLYSEPEVIRQEVSRVLSDFGSENGHVFNLGHGITPGVDPDRVAVFVDSVCLPKIVRPLEIVVFFALQFCSIIIFWVRYFVMLPFCVLKSMYEIKTSRPRSFSSRVL